VIRMPTPARWRWMNQLGMILLDSKKWRRVGTSWYLRKLDNRLKVCLVEDR
jgi:hypothetical protein